eukprot:TRINITY_DN16776_c0_g1_i1.p1 TRINITY_DN16776_c0_g1~~TRINITY_DN16776_c0_g1_i1.p1  ORF type:complete len:154 (+),score=28.03 TRINITY_DN16776_c0_g1_i1:53-514(+)
MDEQDLAALKVQTIYRGHSQRKKTEILKHDTARKKVQEYLRKKKIHNLLQHLISLVAYYKPEEPKQFLVEEIERLARKEKTDLVVDGDLDTIFDMVDITRQGYITGKQLKNMTNNLSIDTGKIDLNQTYTREAFRAALSKGIQTDASSWAVDG